MPRRKGARFELLKERKVTGTHQAQGTRDRRASTLWAMNEKVRVISVKVEISAILQPVSKVLKA